MQPPNIKKTSGTEVKTALKTLLYADAGWGKTTQAVFMEKKYGKTLILSGEAGLNSISNHDMDYVTFSSYKADPKPNTSRLHDLQEWILSDDFQKTDYKCIVLDSLTEASSLIREEIRKEHGNKPNPVMWGDIKNATLGLVKQIRDLPLHVLVTALRQTNTDDNGVTHYGPACGGEGTQNEVMGVFDFVFGGTKKPVTAKDPASGNSHVMSVHHVMAGEQGGWKAKAREPLAVGKRRRIRPETRTGNITALFDDLEMSEEQWQQKVDAIQKQREQHAKQTEGAKQ